VAHSSDRADIEVRRRLTRAALPAVVALIAVTTVWAQSPAGALPPPTCTAGTCTVNFPAAGVVETWTIPAHVSNVTATVAAASGGDTGNGFVGGTGGVVTTSFAVMPGQTMSVAVGEHGQNSSMPAGMGPFPGGEGGYGGGGSGGSSMPRLGPGGGGGSFVTLGSQLLVVAGGGGGGGAGGNGGEGGASGPGSDGDSQLPGSPDAGGGGTESAGGAGGGNLTHGQPGTGPATDSANFGDGGTGDDGTYANGGGGGGYYGGGGGGYGQSGSSASEGAGGGGSGFLATGLTSTATSTNVGDGSVIVTYADPVTTVTTLAVSPAGPVHSGTTSVLTATLVSSPAGATPTGTVTFTDGAVTLGTAAIVNGHATLSVTLPAGTHDLAARYGGAGAFVASATTAAITYAVEADSVTADPLADTGITYIGQLTILGIVLVVLGGATVILTRRRRSK
jgi:hypothetical protein